MVVSTPELGARLRAAGLRPTVGRQTVLGLMLKSDGQPQCCEDLYRLAMASRRSLSVSSIAHALSDLERAGLLVRTTDKDERRLYYRMPLSRALTNPPAIQLARDGRWEALNDPRFAQQLQQWLLQFGVSAGERDLVLIRVEPNSL